ncbi:MAG: aldehyde dehydrogenase family protein [Alphaproteobacteria bacterium]
MSMLKVTSPYDGKAIGEVPLSDTAAIQQKLETAYALYRNKDEWLKPHQRIEILKKFTTLLEKERDDFALLIANEGGKPLMDAKIEVTRAIDGVGLAIKEISNLKGTEIPMGLTAACENHIAFTRREPMGVVVAVSAFNHPMNLIVHQVIPAVAAGCPVIVKPASTTPLNCFRLLELLAEAGLPTGWAQFAACGREAATALVTDARVGFFSFIGSGEVGWKLRSQLADGVRCGMEHGGVAPVIVDETVNLDEIIPPLTKGGFYHAGQVCVSVQRIFAHESIAEKLATKLAESAVKLVVGDATDPATEVGPLIQPYEVDRVEEWVNEAVAAGAKCLTGGERLGDTTYAPTVLLNPPMDIRVSKEEVFGPVVCVYTYRDRLDAIEEANSLPFAFQAAVFTENINTAFDTAERLDATAVMINDHTAFRVDWMPFGGRKSSGMGLGGIGYSMHDMTQDKMFVMRKK